MPEPSPKALDLANKWAPTPEERRFLAIDIEAFAQRARQEGRETFMEGFRMWFRDNWGDDPDEGELLSLLDFHEQAIRSSRE